MNKVFKSEQIYAISKELGVSQVDVKKVLDSYTNRLSDKVKNGETIKFLNICYLVNSSNKNYYNETLAYVSNEIGRETKLGKELVFRVLKTYEDTIIQDLKRFYSHGIRGLVKFKRIEYGEGVYKVRVNKGSNLDSDVRVVTINSFRRKVEGNDRKNT